MSNSILTLAKQDVVASQHSIPSQCLESTTHGMTSNTAMVVGAVDRSALSLISWKQISSPIVRLHIVVTHAQRLENISFVIQMAAARSISYKIISTMTSAQVRAIPSTQIKLSMSRLSSM